MRASLPALIALIAVSSYGGPAFAQGAGYYPGRVYRQSYGQPFGAPGAVQPGFGTQGTGVQPGFGSMGPTQPGFGTQGPGTYYMNNQSGFGFYSGRPGYPYYPGAGYAPGYSPYGPPVAVGGGFYSFKTGGVQINMWKAPSGYYYPWANRSYYGAVVPPVVILHQGVSTPSVPPVTTVFSDLNKYLDEAKANNKLADGDYQHLARRLKDLMSKESTMRIGGGGTLDEGQEQDIRKDLDQLNAEVAQRSKI